jgi:hypothetical protein
MAFTVKQRRWFLGAALALTVVAVAATGGNDDPDGAIVQPGQAKNRHRHKDKEPASGLETNTSLERLDRQNLPESARDMFAVKSWYVAPRPSKVAKPTAPPLPFVYLGKLAEKGEKTVVVLAKENHSYTVREGDILDSNYRVDEVREPLMVLTYLPLNIKQTIQIGESN